MSTLASALLTQDMGQAKQPQATEPQPYPVSSAGVSDLGAWLWTPHREASLSTDNAIGAKSARHPRPQTWGGPPSKGNTMPCAPLPEGQEQYQWLAFMTHLLCVRTCCKHFRHMDSLNPPLQGQVVRPIIVPI